MNHRELKFGSSTLLVVEGVVQEAREWQEARVQTQTHLGGGRSIGTTISHYGQFWLRLDDGREVSVQGPGGFQLRAGHRVRVAGADGAASIRAVALYNLSTGVQQYDDVGARTVWQSGWWGWMALLVMVAMIVLLLLGLLLWALSTRHGIFYLTPAVMVAVAGIGFDVRRARRFRQFVWAAMG